MAMSAFLSQSLSNSSSSATLRRRAYLTSNYNSNGFSANLSTSRSKKLHLSRKFFVAVSSQELSGGHAAEKPIELPTEPKPVESNLTSKEEVKESSKADAEPFDSLHKSTEQLQIELEKSKDSLDEVLSHKAVDKEDKEPVAAETVVANAPKKGAKLHDFCLGIPFGGILVCGGLAGFIINQDIVGLLAGIGVLTLSISSLKVWKSGKSSTPYIVGQAALALFLLAKQLQAFFMTKTLFPTGLFVGLSAAMLSFYSYVIASGGNPASKKLRTNQGTSAEFMTYSNSISQKQDVNSHL